MLVLKILLGALLVFALLLLVVAYVVFTMTASKRTQQKPYNTKLENDRHKFYEFDPEDVAVQTADGLTLRGWLIEAPRKTKRFVIFSHGHKVDGTENFADQVPFYHNEMNCNILMPDHRAHGRSEGKHVTFGAFDHKDILLWCDFLVERYGEDIEIVMQGISMGAATIMLVNNNNPPEQIKFFIEDCGFTSAPEIINNTLKDTVGFRCMPLVKLSSFLCKRIAGYSYQDIDCIGTMQNAARPMLVVHGTKDSYVPTYMGEEIFKAFPLEKDLFLVEDSPHAENFYVDPEGYQNWIRVYANRYFTPESE